MLDAPGIPSGQCVGQCPSAFDSERQRGRCDADALRPSLEHHRLTIKRDEPGAGPVAGLLSGRGPSAVFWRVVAIVVDPIKRKAAGLFAHVRQEVRKAIGPAPAFAYLDASSAVAVKKPVRRIAATVVHGGPDSVCRCFGHAVLARGWCAATRELLHPLEKGRRHCNHISAVADAFPDAPSLVSDSVASHEVPRNKHVKSSASDVLAAFKRLLCAFAAAGCGSSAAKVIGCANCIVSAVAQAKPKRLAGRVSACWSLGHETAKALVCKVKWCSHARYVRIMNCTYCNLFGAAANGTTV